MKILLLAFAAGPYVQAVGPDAATILWEGPAGAVEARGSNGVTVRAQAELYEGVARARLSGLSPGTTWRYTVLAAGTRAEGRFATPPVAGQGFTFAVYGDNRTDHRAHAAVAAAVRLASPDLLLSTGDLVSRGGRRAHWLRFFEVERALLSETVLYPVLGNHEVAEDAEAQRFRRWFELPGNELYYAFTWGNVRFLAIDGEINVDPDKGPDGPQRTWLLREITSARDNPGIDHVVGFVHKGPYSSNPGRNGNAGLRNALPELQAAGLTLLLSGHDHFYERGVNDRGLPYLVVGSGGAPLYPTTGPGKYDGYTAHISRSVHAYARFRVQGRHLSGCAVDLSGVAFDCFDLAQK